MLVRLLFNKAILLIFVYAILKYTQTISKRHTGNSRKRYINLILPFVIGISLTAFAFTIDVYINKPKSVRESFYSYFTEKRVLADVKIDDMNLMFYKSNNSDPFPYDFAILKETGSSWKLIESNYKVEKSSFGYGGIDYMALRVLMPDSDDNIMVLITEMKVSTINDSLNNQFQHTILESKFNIYYTKFLSQNNNYQINIDDKVIPLYLERGNNE